MIWCGRGSHTEDLVNMPSWIVAALTFPFPLDTSLTQRSIALREILCHTSVWTTVCPINRVLSLSLPSSSPRYSSIPLTCNTHFVNTISHHVDFYRRRLHGYSTIQVKNSFKSRCFPQCLPISLCLVLCHECAHRIVAPCGFCSTHIPKRSQGMPLSFLLQGLH